jgi:hypothetical protein
MKVVLVICHGLRKLVGAYDLCLPILQVGV